MPDKLRLLDIFDFFNSGDDRIGKVTFDREILGHSPRGLEKWFQLSAVRKDLDVQGEVRLETTITEKVGMLGPTRSPESWLGRMSQEDLPNTGSKRPVNRLRAITWVIKVFFTLVCIGLSPHEQLWRFRRECLSDQRKITSATASKRHRDTEK